MTTNEPSRQAAAERLTERKKLRQARIFSRIANRFTRLAGSPIASILAVALIILWLITGPIFHFSDTWQLVINTGTTIITFIMVFIIQQSQNKDTIALQLKLNELIASHEKASNRLIDIEDLTELELDQLKQFYIKLAELSEKDNDLFSSHSLDEANENHREKIHSKGLKKRVTE